MHHRTNRMPVLATSVNSLVNHKARNLLTRVSILHVCLCGIYLKAAESDDFLQTSARNPDMGFRFRGPSDLCRERLLVSRER